jgi:hypothetical protein
MNSVRMTEPLTNAILASILHLIWRDLVKNRRVPPRRALPHWVRPHRAPTHRWHHRPAGADQWQRHHPHSTGPWNRLYQE